MRPVSVRVYAPERFVAEQYRLGEDRMHPIDVEISVRCIDRYILYPVQRPVTPEKRGCRRRAPAHELTIRTPKSCGASIRTNECKRLRVEPPDVSSSITYLRTTR